MNCNCKIINFYKQQQQRKIYRNKATNKCVGFFIFVFWSKSTQGVNMNNKTEYYIESCTLHDDQYLVYHDLIQSASDSGANSDGFGAKSHLSAGGFSFTFKNDNRLILW